MTNIPLKKLYLIPPSPFKSSARSLGNLTNNLLSSALGERGFASSEIIQRWSAIVGHNLSRVSIPERIVWPHNRPQELPDSQRSRSNKSEGGTLYIRVDGPAAIEIQHMNNHIIETVNRFFGFTAISILRIKQAPLEQQKLRKALVRPFPSSVAQELPNGEENLLENALERLKIALKNKEK